MVLDILLLSIGFLGLVIATITDLKTKEVPDIVNYGLIIIGSAIHIFNAIILNEWKPLIYTVLGFIVFFAIANLMYYTKQWGGGDAKLLMALSIIFSKYPSSLLNYFSPNLEPFPYLMIFFINLLLIGSIYGLLYTIFIAVKAKKDFYREYKEVASNPSIKLVRYSSMFVAILFLGIIMVFQPSLLSPLTITLVIFILVFPYIFIFVKIIEKTSMYKQIDISKLTEGDWVAADIRVGNRLIYKASSPGITKDQIQQLKNHDIRKVIVKEGIPFVPSFLLAAIFSLIFGNPLPI